MAGKKSKTELAVSFNYFALILRNIANKHWSVQALIVGIILLLGVTLRAVQADRYPINNLDDGIYYVWAGVSFWQNPLAVTSLTLFDSDNDRLFWRSQYLDELPSQEFGFRLVQPWFDHPPFGVAIIGLPAYLLGYTNFENIPYGIVRLPAVLASILTLLLSFLLFKRLFGVKQSVIATFILATTPYFVFAQRQSYLENILTPFFLLAVWQGYEVISKKSRSKLSWLLAVGASFLCGWIKLVGLVIPLILAVWGIKKGYKKAVTVFAGTFLASLGSYVGYGLLSDADGFWQTIMNQGGRGMLWGNGADIIVNQSLAGVFKDTTLLLGWIAVFIFIFVSSQKNSNKTDDSAEFFTWVFVSWLSVVVVSSGQHNNFIWYRYPMFPLLSYGIAWLIIQLWHRPNILASVLVVLLGWSQLFVVFPSLLENGGTRIIVLATLSVPFVTYVLSAVKKINTLFFHKVWLLLLCLIIVITNVLVVIKFPEYNCTHVEHCVLPTKIIVRE